MKHIAILGSTGSIGTQALEVIRHMPERLRVSVLTAHTQIDLLERQMAEFNPVAVAVTDPTAAARLRARYAGPVRIYSGERALCEAAVSAETDIVLTAVSGAVGIEPTLAAIAAGKTIALANKETLVAAGDLVMARAAEAGVRILPVDSEHSAIFQCLEGREAAAVERLILTASGGPFRGYSSAQLEQVSVADCLRHPTWNMGKKITIDSATLFNKGLEVIEAHHLFGMDYDAIRVTVHPQSIVHSMVELRDGAVLAQLGVPDMKLPIQLAFTWPERLPVPEERLTWTEALDLHFEPPATAVFRSLPLAYAAGKVGKSAPLALNAANEVAVAAFCDGAIGFTSIFTVVEQVLVAHQPAALRDWPDIDAADREARILAAEEVRRLQTRQA